MAPKRNKPRLSEESARLALERSGGLCACGCGWTATEWHHVFGQRLYPKLVDEPDNIVAVAARCHSAHTNWVRRFPRATCRHAERLAVTPKMQNYLDRNYGGLS
jgi:hypothetical protein